MRRCLRPNQRSEGRGYMSAAPISKKSIAAIGSLAWPTAEPPVQAFTRHVALGPPTHSTVCVVGTDAAELSNRLSISPPDVRTRAFQNGRELLSQLQFSAGCIVIDCPLPDMTGLRLQAILNARQVRIPVVFLADDHDAMTAVEAMRQGAFDYLVRPVHDKRLHDCLLTAVLGSSRTEALRRQVEQCRKSLTSRERDVMQLLMEGDSTKQIAAHFRITVQTAIKHRSRVLSKMCVDNEVQLLRLLMAMS